MNVETEQPLFMDPRLPMERPGLPADFGVGSPVVVIEPSHRRRDKPTLVAGVVTDKARVWIVVKTAQPNRVYRLRLDSQTDGSDSIYDYRFRTPQQHAWEEAQNAAWQYLAEQGVRLDFSSPWRNQPMSLARSIYATFGPTEREDTP